MGTVSRNSKLSKPDVGISDCSTFMSQFSPLRGLGFIFQYMSDLLVDAMEFDEPATSIFPVFVRAVWVEKAVVAKKASRVSATGA